MSIKLRIYVGVPELGDDGSNISLAEFIGSSDEVLVNMKTVLNEVNRVWMERGGDRLKVRYHVSVVAPKTPSPKDSGEVIKLTDFESSPDSVFWQIAKDTRACINNYKEN